MISIQNQIIVENQMNQLCFNIQIVMKQNRRTCQDIDLDNCKVLDEVLWKDDRLCVFQSMITWLIREAHDLSINNHFEMNWTLNLLRWFYCWSKMRTIIKCYIQNCYVYHKSKALRVDLSSSLSCSTQFRLSFSVELSWEESTQLNWVKSDSQFNSVNLMSWLELNCRPTFYQIFYQIFYQSDQTLYQTFYQTLYHVFYHIFHHISHYIFHHISYYVFYHISYHISHHIFYYVSHYILYHILYYTFYHIFHHIFHHISHYILYHISHQPLYQILYQIDRKIDYKKKLKKKRESILFLVHSILYLVTLIKFKQLNSILSWTRIEESQFNLNLNSELSWVDFSQFNSTLTWRQI